MKKIIDFFKIKKNDELIFYKILAWIILIISVWSIFEDISGKVQDYIVDSKKEELVLKIDSIQSSNTSLEVYAKTNLPNGTEISMFAKPVEGLDKLGFSESGLGVVGFSKVRDGKINIKFQGLGKPGKEYVICKTPYEIDASIYLGDSFKTYDDFEKKYKENDNIEVNSPLESISYPLGKYEIKNGLSLSEYKKYCVDEQIDKDKPSKQNQKNEYGEGEESFEGGDMYHRELYSRAKSELLAINDTKLMNDYLNNNLNIDSMYDYHSELSELKNISTSWADTLWGERNCSNKADIEKEKEERLYISKIVSSLEPTITTVDHYNDGYMSIDEDQVLNEIKATMKIVNTNLNKINNINFIN